MYVASILSNNNNQNNGDIHVTNHFAFNYGVSLKEPFWFDFSVYPNPAKDEINISFSQKQQENIVIFLCDIKGSETIIFDGKYNQNLKSIALPTNISSGLYTLEVQSIHGRFSKLLTIQ